MNQHQKGAKQKEESKAAEERVCPKRKTPTTIAMVAQTTYTPTGEKPSQRERARDTRDCPDRSPQNPTTNINSDRAMCNQQIIQEKSHRERVAHWTTTRQRRRRGKQKLGRRERPCEVEPHHQIPSLRILYNVSSLQLRY
jgi:hypothetical protein